jgi:hypothetical protein
MMLAAVVEKFSFAIACVVLSVQGRLAAQMLAAGMFDLTLGTLFAIAWWRLRTDGQR